MSDYYNADERAAQAEALGISYGRIMFLIENNLPFPAQIRPIRWPIDSLHAEETVVLRGTPRPMEPKKKPVEEPERRISAKSGRCMNCGLYSEKAGMVTIYARDCGRHQNQRRIGHLCNGCKEDWFKLWVPEVTPLG